MPIADTISSIVANRQNEIAHKYNSCWQGVEKIITFAEKLNTVIKSDNWKILLRNYPEFKAEWEEIKDDVIEYIKSVRQNVGVLNDKIYEPKGYFEAIANKIAKDEIEVCITGPVSTGKSVFLRALTGAPETVIPSGKGKTTAARTIFCNSNNKSAIIKFLSTEEFNKIINEYVLQLNKELQRQNKSQFPLWDFSKCTLREFCTKIKAHSSYNSHNFGKSTISGVDTIVTADKYFETFTFYIDNCSHYASYLDHVDEPLTESQINEGKLVPYVSYKKSTDYTGEPYCRALAVREAIVNWPLRTVNDEDLGSIRLVDTMGIGEAKFCVEEDLLKIVREHADLAVALCRILSDNDNAENINNSCFIKVLSKIRDRKMEDWVYYLCNKEDNAHITDDTVESFQKQIWKEMQGNADHFILNEDYWDSINFIEKGRENSTAIVDYFVNVVLGNLENNISNVDNYFLVKLQEEYENCINGQNKILKSLKSCLNVLPSFSDIDKTKKIDEQVDTIITELNQRLKDFRAELFEKDTILCKQIINSVRPILKDPEVFSVYGIKDVQYHVKAAFDNLFKNALLAINELIISSESLDIKWIDIKKEVINKAVVNSNLDKSTVEKRIEQAGSFFENYLNKSCQAIATNIKRIKTNLNVDDPKHSCNYTGRELEFFIHTREQLYEAIWDKMSLASEQVGITDKDVTDVKESLCVVVRDIMKKHNIFVTSEEKPITWMQDFTNQIQSDAFGSAIQDFLDSVIDLPSIVDDQTGKELRRNLLNVSLIYTDEFTAAKSIWNSLCMLDIILRNDLLHKYEKTFQEYNVYVNLVTPLFDNVFCTDQNDYGKFMSEPYKEFKAYIKNVVAENYEKEDTAKCADVAHLFRELCKQ